MKRILTAAIILMTILTGCTGELKERIAALDEQVTKMEEELEKMNTTISSLYTVLYAYQKKDFITGISQLDDNAGYAIHFNTAGDIVIYHGSDAHVPRVGIKRNPDDGNYYWTIQYGNNEPQYIINEAGDMVSAVGMVPLLKIENGKFYISYDSRKTWQYLGQADGANGDDIFKKISYNEDYVIFETYEETFKFPTNKLVQNLTQSASTINQNIVGLTTLIKDLAKNSVCVVSVSDYVVDGKVAGSVVLLSNGEKLVVKDWIDSGSPYISAEKGPGDSVYYWAIVSADGSIEWIRDPEGNRMAATEPNLEIPVVVPVLDESDKTYYWSVVAAGDTTLVLDINGDKVPVTSSGGELALFKKVDNSARDFITITMANGSTVTIPKIYTIAFGTESLSMKPSTTKTVSYRIYGYDIYFRSSLITQGDLTATASADNENPGSGKITIKTGAGFTGNGKVVMVVYAGNGSTKTMVKSINVAKED